MRGYLISCLEKGEFRIFPNLQMCQVGTYVKWNTTVEINCDCGEADAIEDIVGCDCKNGLKKCIVCKHESCTDAEPEKAWYCTKHSPT